MCGEHSFRHSNAIGRREFLAITATAAAALPAASTLVEARTADSGVPDVFPRGDALRIKPALLYTLYERRDRDSWRSTGGLQSRADVDAEARRIEGELRALAARADFPIQVQPISLVPDRAKAAALRESEADVMLLFAAGTPGAGASKGAESGKTALEQAVDCGKPSLIFLRRTSGPIYYYTKGANFRFLRKSSDDIQETHIGVDDIVVDDYEGILWRLRALYGLKNTKGTKSLALGGLQAIYAESARKGPDYAKNVWGFKIIEYPAAALQEKLALARQDRNQVQEAERQVDGLLAQPGVTLATDRKFVFNTVLARNVVRGLMKETGATSVGVARCMDALIPVLDTPPCLMLSLLNDEGYVAFCHNDFAQTPPGVLLRWISGKPVFLANSYYPYQGLWTVAHCSSPRRMDGVTSEPVRITTHYESDYGAATKVHYPKGQPVTCIVPNLRCTKWFAFRARIVDSPSFAMCRSQMDIQIDGDWRALVREMEGFHTIVTYGDYLREAGYAVRKAGAIEWKNYSEPA